MKSVISLITLGVEDLPRSRAFYESLGFRAAGPAEETVCFLQLSNLVLSLYLRSMLAEDIGVQPEGSGFSGITLAHNVPQKTDVAAVLAEAQKAGGRIVKPAHEASWGGCIGFFADPDGHLWEVAWNPHFPLNDDGTVRLPG